MLAHPQVALTSMRRLALCAGLACAGLAPFAHAQAPSEPSLQHPNATPIAARWQAGDGPFEVATVHATLRDDRRAKELELIVRFPIVPDSEPWRFPLVIFSHGMGGNRDAFAALSTFWASHGYIVVHPTHSDSVELLKRTDPKAARGFLANPRQYIQRVDPADRLADVVFVLDSLDAIEALDTRLSRPSSNEPLKTPRVGRISREQIAMAGHSAGAMTTQMAIGVQVRGAKGLSPGESLRQRMQLRSVGDARFDVGLIISGQGTSNRLFTDKSWQAVPVPTLTITGSNDTSHASDETPEGRRQPFELAPGKAKGAQPAFLLWLEGATHGSYQGKELTHLLREQDVPNIDTIVRATKVVTLATLDAFLKDDQLARALLQDANQAKDVTAGVALLKHK